VREGENKWEEEIPLKVSQVSEGFFGFDFSFLVHYLSSALRLRLSRQQVRVQFKS